MPNSNDLSLRDRQRAFSNALANQRLAGQEPDPRTVAELALVVNGELTIETVLERVRARIAAGDFGQKPDR
ncbi:hypothetical protein KDH83_20500 [Achromobacter sp. Marseille-Q0513]|uniref:antitoxin VbhA family protein n=1 Tax=Achromobacter sp. Marseille-Q0513 TaxID=2829161 RepID=UPI001B99D2A8|nr:antitoxin VbhA family protein [Achromobacter sp. Marseille-Q0513]MBR8655690.1 hypothetical protein [Achromobacter sp. Marseille-Q0513]